MNDIKVSFCLEYREEIEDYVIKCQIHHPMFVDNRWVIKSFDKRPSPLIIDDIIQTTKRAMDIMLHNFRFNPPSIDNEHIFKDWTK